VASKQRHRADAFPKGSTKSQLGDYKIITLLILEMNKVPVARHLIMAVLGENIA
jgi:hypothetical protein